MTKIKTFALIALLLLSFAPNTPAADTLLYVAVPGVRNYLEYGGHGLLVFDVANNHRFVKRIPTAGLDEKGQPLNVKGLCASAQTGRIYITTLRTVICLDLVTEKVLWEKAYEGGCDRLSISPDGKVLYVPTLEKLHWNVVDALTGNLISKVVTNSGAHNTIYAPSGKEVYMAGLLSPYLFVADTHTHTVSKKIGPFSASIRPFTIDPSRDLVFVNINSLLGFEVGNLKTGEKLHRVEVEGFKQGPVKRHGCPSHGVGLTPNGKELWLTDAANRRLHLYDVSKLPPKKSGDIVLRDEPGWVTFSIDGKLAYPSTGEIIDVRKRTILGQLKDERGADVQSEKMLQVQWKGKKPVRAGNQFAIAR